MLSSSNGNWPTKSEYNRIPALQTSTAGPEYVSPRSNSGAAYAGLPQQVCKNDNAALFF